MNKRKENKLTNFPFIRVLPQALVPLQEIFHSSLHDIFKKATEKCFHSVYPTETILESTVVPKIQLSVNIHRHLLKVLDFPYTISFIIKLLVSSQLPLQMASISQNFFSVCMKTIYLRTIEMYTCSSLSVQCLSIHIQHCVFFHI